MPAGVLELVDEVDSKSIASDGVRVRPLVVGSWMYVFGNGGKLVAYTIR